MKQISLLAVVALLVTTAATATVFQPTTDRQLLDRSAIVVVATVRDATAHVRPDGYVATDYRLDVEQTLKGNVDRSITVSEIGGAAGNRFTFISDSATYAPGEKVIAFLKARGDGTYFTTSMAMGKFSFTRAANGESVVVREVSELADDPARNVDAFEQFLRDPNQGSLITQSYARKLTPISSALHPRTLALASAYVLPGCGTPGCFPVRVAGGESGGGLAFRSSGSLPGVDGPGGISAAAATWTNDPSSFIVLSYAGTSPSPAPDPDDGVNVVYLNYSGSDIGICDSGMACTLGVGNTTHPYKGETFVGITDADVLIRPGISASLYQQLITHELGHSIGLRHSDQGTPFSSSAVMASTVTTSALQAWDIEALSFVYGNGPVCQAPTSVSISGGGTYQSGQTATLIAIVTGGNGTFTYAWFEGALGNTTNPVGTNSSTFTTPPITSTKDYWVRVTNACGNVTAATSVVMQPIGPGCTAAFVNSQPSSQTISSGGTATFNASAGGTSPFSYQWYQATSTGDTSKPVGTNSASFTTPALAQTTSYFLRITNGCGTANTSVVTATVQGGVCPKPVFNLQPASASLLAGTQTYLYAFATGANSYQWFKGNAGDTSTPVAGLPPSNDRWVSQLYIDLLGRAPDASSLALYSGLLTTQSRTSVALTFLKSNEYRQRLLTEFYSTFLHRSISAGEVTLWLGAFGAGLTDEQIEAQIIASPEYFALAGSTNSGFIDHLYNDVLGRAPSGIESANLAALLGSSSRFGVATAVLTSPESATRRVNQYYARLLHRTPTSADASTFTSLLLTGFTNEEIIAAILASDEYFSFGTLLFTGPVNPTTRYWVRATNQCGTADSDVAVLTVPQCKSPEIVTQPAGVSLTNGDTFSLAVVATGADTYQWFRASSGDPSNPIAGATGAVLTSSINNVGPTQFWVRITNACGSTNSNTVTVTTVCGTHVLSLFVPPTHPFGSTYPVSWNGNAALDTQYELQEATKADFSDAQTFTLTSASTSKTFSHTVVIDTRYYYRVHAAPTCGGNFGAYSAVGSVLVTALQPPNSPSFHFAQLPCLGCFITQKILIPAVHTAGKTALATTDQFTIASDKPFITISPSSGPLPPEGATVTATIDMSQLDLGSTEATISMQQLSGSGKTRTLGDPPPINVPVSVSVVAPVTSKGKDPNGGFNALLIPAVAHADGSGTRFVSDLRITNTSAQSINYQVTFTPQNTDGTQSGKQISFSIAAGDTKALNDVVKDWYGSGVNGEPGIGSLEIRPTNFAGKDPVTITLATVAASRTYSVTSLGTFGQFIPALPVVNFLAKSDVSKISLQQVSQSNTSGGFRTNLGFVEGSGQPVNFTATLYSDAGSKITERAYSLKPYESQQSRLDAFFNVNGVSLPNIADARVEVKVTSDTGHVSAYASVLDNTTTDPLLVFPADPSRVTAKRFVVPGVAEFASSFSNFHTDMRIYNGGSAPVDVTLSFNGSAAASTPDKVRTIAAGETLAIDNVLPALWNTTGGGSVVATTANNASLVLTARTFSRDPSNGGTFGQFIPGVTASDAVGNGERALQIVQLEESPAFRTNLGLVEVTGNPATVELQAITPDSKVATKVTLTLNPGQYLQQNGILKSLGFSNVYNARITAKVTAGTGRVAAFGSVIDNRTTDPTYVPSQ